MTETILTDLSTPALAQAAETNLHEFLRYLGRATHTPPLADPSLTRWHTQVPYPWFNGMLAERPAAAGDEQVVAEAIAWFTAQGFAQFTWWLAPTIPRAGWAPLLQAQGFRGPFGPPGMALDLETLDAKKTALPGLKIVPVTDAATLQTWAHTFIVGYELPLEWEASLLQMMIELGLDLPIRNYLGYLDGAPVATSNLFLGAGVAGVQCVATLPGARGRGLGGALTLAPLREARQMGYRAGVLQSSEMGYSVYRRLGFQPVCQVQAYYWQA